VTAIADARWQVAARIVATACNAALITYGVMTLPLTWGWGAMTALACYAIAFGALNLFVMFRGQRFARDSSGARRLRVGAAVLNGSLPVVFAALSFASGGVSLLEWGGTLLMLVPALANWLAIGSVPITP
jgi:hypothetical protein